MPGRTVPSDDGPTALERVLVRLGRTALGVLYVGMALLGVLHLDPLTMLLTAPFFSVLVACLRWSIHQTLHSEATPSIELLLPAATVGALFAPFGAGVQLLGDRGGYLMLVLIGLLTVLGSHWLYRLEVPTGRAAVEDRSAPPPPRPAESAHHPPRELLQQLTLDDLADEWRRSGEPFHRTSPVDRRAAVEWRGALLDELERRDPQGFHDWVRSGMARGPERHLRAGRDGAPTGPDDSIR